MLRISLFWLVTVANVGWLLAYLIAVITDPGSRDSDSVLGFVIIQVPLILIWIPLYRRMRRPRLPRRGAGARAEYVMRNLIQRAPAGKHDLSVNPTAARTLLRERDFRAAHRLPGAVRDSDAQVEFADVGRRLRLDRAEQTLGNALYLLDQHRDSLGLTKQQISALRVTGVVASAWVSTQADQAAGRVLGARTASHQLEEAIRLLTDLAQQTHAFLKGRVGAEQLDQAADRLVRLVAG